MVHRQAAPDCRWKHHYDAAGNRWITLRGESEKALLIGSHLDSVPNGGWLDGCLGVMTALEVLRGFADTIQRRVRRSPCVWSIGRMKKARASGAACWAPRPSPGTHSIEADRGRTDRDGIRLEDALRRCGVEIDRFPEAQARAEECRGLPGTAHRAGAGAGSAWACRSAWCSGQRAWSGTPSHFTGRRRTPGRRR